MPPVESAAESTLIAKDNGGHAAAATLQKEVINERLKGGSSDAQPHNDDAKNAVLSFHPKASDYGRDGTLRRLDENGNLIAVDFKDHPEKSHTYGYNDKNELISVDHKDGATGENLSLRKDEKNNSWYMDKDGLRLYLPGKVEVRPSGEFGVEQKDGSWRLQDRLGNVVQERRLASGAAVQYNDDQTPKKIVRPDGTEISCNYENGQLCRLSETSKDGTTKSWVRNQAGDFQEQGGSEVRKEMKVDGNGNINFKAADGSMHTLTGDGAHVRAGQDGKGSSTYDGEGRLSKFTYADGGSREFEYDGKTNTVSKLKVRNDKNEVTDTYERVGDKQEWKYSKGDTPGGTWKGEIKTEADGSWKFNETDKTRNPEGFWTNVDNQGKKTFVDENKDGSKVTYDADKRFSSILRPDGSTVSWEGNKEYAKVHATMPDGKKMNFEYDMKGKVWKSDNPDVKESADLPVRGDGRLVYQTKDGTTTVNTDSSTSLKRPDGTIVDTDAQHRLLRTVSRTGNERVFEHSRVQGECVGDVCTLPRDQITGYTEHVKGKPDNHVDLSKDSDVRITAKGDIFHTTEQGKRLIETGDFAHVECNDAGKPVKVTAANGAVREIEWNPKTNEAASISDTIKTNAGEVSRKWETAPDWHGTFAVVGEKDGKLTQRFARHDVKIDDVGNYQYTTQSGDRILSKPGEGAKTGDSVVAGNAWASHENLMETMRRHMSASQLQRMEGMMNQFEKRQQLLADFQVVNGAGDRTTIEDKHSAVVSKTYDQLAELVSSPTGFYDAATRTKLAEDFMFHAADPTTMNQGGTTGTCWIEAGHIAGGMVSHTDELARLIKEVSLTQSYHTTNPSLYPNYTKRDFHFSDRLLTMGQGDRGGSWTIDSSNQNVRSPIGFILDQTLPVIGGRPEGHSNAGYWGGQDGAHNIMWMVAGADLQAGADGVGKREMQYLIKEGAFTTSGSGHMWGYQLAVVGDKLAVVRDDQYPGKDSIAMNVPDKTPVTINREYSQLANYIRKIPFQPLAKTEPDVPIAGQPGRRNTPQHQEDTTNQPYRPYQPYQPDQPDQPVRPIRRILRRWFR